MAHRFAKVSEEKSKTAFFYPSDLVNTKTTMPLRVGEKRWIYTSTLRVSVHIHHYSPQLRGIVVYYYIMPINVNVVNEMIPYKGIFVIYYIIYGCVTGVSILWYSRLPIS